MLSKLPVIYISFAVVAIPRHVQEVGLPSDHLAFPRPLHHQSILSATVSSREHLKQDSYSL